MARRTLVDDGKLRGLDALRATLKAEAWACEIALYFDEQEDSGVALDEVDSRVLERVAADGIAEVAASIPENSGDLIVQRVRSDVWERSIDGIEHVPAGAAFAAYGLRFLSRDEPVALYETGPWTRLTTRRGHVLVRRKPWTLRR